MSKYCEGFGLGKIFQLCSPILFPLIGNFESNMVLYYSSCHSSYSEDLIVGILKPFNGYECEGEPVKGVLWRVLLEPNIISPTMTVI